MAGSVSRVWRLSEERSIELEPWCLMAVLNATPDSFSDGGEHLDPERAAVWMWKYQNARMKVQTSVRLCRA